MDLVKYYISKMKILFITPHLSTGGGPQYLLKKIQELHTEHDVYCIEYSNVTGGVLIVQRSQIESILGSRLITLHDNKFELIDHINNINPDVIHFEELPEYFCDNDIATHIYVSDRKYKIIETSHDSSFDVSTKRFFPDRFIFVSKYQKQLFDSLQIPSDIVEYPIEYKQKKDRTQSLLELGLDPNKTHFLNIGLFTSRKNQAEIIEYARLLINENVQFHFVGNQADNFRSYWEPLMKDFPANCKWWGERRDVDTFYNAMDVFLFTSKGTNSDKETNPLVIREAIGWNMPILMYNLPVYLGMYDIYENIEYLSDDISNNIKLILNYIKKDTYTDIIITYDNTQNKINYHVNHDIYDVIVVVKDIDSKTVLYSSVHNVLKPNIDYWIIPVPKQYRDFETDEYFGGMSIEIYTNECLIYTKDFRIKFTNVYKPVLKTKNIISPTYNNYMEFFVFKIYDEYLSGKKFDVVVDIGANTGIWIEYIKYVATCNKIYAFDPNVQAMRVLKNTYESDDNIILIQKALTNVDSEIELFVNNNNSTISSVVKCDELSSSYKVDSISFKTFIKTYNINKIDLMKIDIESGEYDLFESMSKNELDIIDNLLIEYHTDLWGRDIKDVKTITSLLRGAGFKYYIKPQHNNGGFIFATKQ